MTKKGSVLLICKHKFVSILEEGAIDGFIAMQVSLGFITSTSEFKRKVKNFLTKPKMLPAGTEAVVRRGSIKKMFFKNFAKFIRKQIYRTFFFDKVAALQAATL